MILSRIKIPLRQERKIGRYIICQNLVLPKDFRLPELPSLLAPSGTPSGPEVAGQKPILPVAWKEAGKGEEGKAQGEGMRADNEKTAQLRAVSGPEPMLNSGILTDKNSIANRQNLDNQKPAKAGSLGDSNLVHESGLPSTKRISDIGDSVKRDLSGILKQLEQG